MKHVVILIFILSVLTSCGVLDTTSTEIVKEVKGAIDLVNLDDDRLRVHITPATILKDSAVFYMPETVPGTYSDDDYGRFIDSLKVFSKRGKRLEVLQTSPNTWKIPQSRQLGHLEYLVNDTYDVENTHEIFSPAGTNFKNAKQFLLNLHGIFGYFKNQEDLPYYLDIYRPTNLVGTTSLPSYKDSLYTPFPFVTIDNRQNTVDTYRAERYFDIIDNPIMYNPENNIDFTIDDIKITLSVYSPTGLIKAEELQPNMEQMMRAQKNYLGDLDATKYYNILLYLTDGSPEDAQGYGALEHHTSTVTVLPEAMPKEQMDAVLLDVVSHEFFHIVTPLNLHSTQIHKFKYNDPEMSMHLWLYEGVTEYFAQHFQVQQGLIAPDEFYQTILKKIEFSNLYDDAMSFTKMSKNVLSEPYASNYGNVYEKGALIGMCLDILMRQASDGERGLLDLMKELTQLYGPNRPFEDNTLIPEITRRTYPEIEEFFNKHVIGTVPIQYRDFFDIVGLEYNSKMVDTGFFINRQSPYINANEKGEIYILPVELHTFFKSFGIQGNDIIKSINGTSYNFENVAQLINDSNTWNLDDPITFTIIRDGEEIVLSGNVTQPQIRTPELTELNSPNNSTSEKIRNSWLKSS